MGSGGGRETTARITVGSQFALNALHHFQLPTALGYSHVGYDRELTLAQSSEKFGAKLSALPARILSGYWTVPLEMGIPHRPGTKRPGDSEIYHTLRFWIAPAMDFSPLRIEMIHTPDGRFRQRYDMTYTRIGGVALPASYRIDTFLEKDAQGHTGPCPVKHLFIDIKLNEPLPDPKHFIEIPDGAKVTDEIAGISYVKGGE